MLQWLTCVCACLFAVYRACLAPLFASFWAELEQRELMLRSLPYAFDAWPRQDLLCLAYWMQPIPLKDVSVAGVVVFVDAFANRVSK